MQRVRDWLFAKWCETETIIPQVNDWLFGNGVMLTRYNHKPVAALFELCGANLMLQKQKKIKNWFMLSARISSYGCARDVWRTESQVVYQPLNHRNL